MIQLENDIHLDYNPIQLDTIEIELENDMRAIEMTPAEIDLENDLKWDPDLRTFIDWTLCNWHVFSKVLDVTIFFYKIWPFFCQYMWTMWRLQMSKKNWTLAETWVNPCQLKIVHSAKCSLIWISFLRAIEIDPMNSDRLRGEMPNAPGAMVLTTHNIPYDYLHT